MGVVNVTPDSFSDGGRFLAPQAAIDLALRLAADGADLIDIGGESTRPYSQPVLPDEQARRVLPVIEDLVGRVGVPISIDTSSAVVAREALAAGAEIVNDVTALAGDEDMLEVVLRSRCGVCLMHMQGTPATMQDNPQYGDVVAEVLDYLRCRRDALLAAGVPHDSIALDPGIGFGKTHQHNLTLLASAYRLHELGCPVLVGHSRKGFIAKVLADKEVDRTAGSIGVSLSLAAQGVQVIRVHDVAAVRQAVLLFEATGGIDGRAAVVE
ncbi:MAG: dihydropteroate synthase [Pirellulales bacterium]|nr:dihydropteroate synthase [Pirellulales bacterium]